MTIPPPPDTPPTVHLIKDQADDRPLGQGDTLVNGVDRPPTDGHPQQIHHHHHHHYAPAYEVSPADPGTAKRFDLSQIRLSYNVCCVCASIPIAPATIRILHFFGDEYAPGLLIISAGVAFDRCAPPHPMGKHRWIRRTLLWATVVGFCADIPALHELTAYTLRVLFGVTL